VSTASAPAGLEELLAATKPAPLAPARLPTLRAPVRVAVDASGVPTLTGETLADVALALGYVTARDRLFQLDLLRRTAEGRLAALVGPAAVDADVRQRTLGIGRAAPALLDALPAEQRELLDAYAAGVNAWLERGGPSFEHRLLGAEPEPWRALDGLLVAALMAQLLASDGSDKRCADVIRRHLPPAAADFMLAAADPYAVGIDGRSVAGELPELPPELAELAAAARSRPPSRPVVAVPDARGSNAWAVAGSRTRDGRALVANDMHLYLSIPDVWYRAVLRYGETCVEGLVLPGVPVVVAGTNGAVAWGCTRLTGDTLDLVEVELDPQDATRYWDGSGWSALRSVEERVGVRGGEPVDLAIRETQWGPVVGAPLEGRPLALRWSALEPGGLDLTLARLAEARTVDEACDVANRAGAPAVNVLVGSADGRIGWTVAGRFPARAPGGDPVVRPRLGGRTWERLLEPEELPRVVDPPTGKLASGNNLTPEHGERVAWNGFGAVRAARVAAELEHVPQDEEGSFALQHDVDASFYAFYRDVALRCLDREEALPAAGAAIAAWDGTAGVDAAGLVLLVLFRELVRESLFASFLQPCVDADPDFAYAWHDHEGQLRALLTTQPEELTPAPHATFGEFLAAMVDLACRLLAEQGYDPTAARWGDVNRAGIRHPLSQGPEPSPGLDRPDVAVPGCAEAVRVAWPGFGASMRLVVAPGRHGDALLTVPGGQSGHPLDPAYADGWESWLRGLPRRFEPGPPATAVTLEPRGAAPRGAAGAATRAAG
jgi:penicillin G amidase